MAAGACVGAAVGVGVSAAGAVSPSSLRLRFTTKAMATTTMASAKSEMVATRMLSSPSCSGFRSPRGIQRVPGVAKGVRGRPGGRAPAPPAADAVGVAAEGSLASAAAALAAAAEAALSAGAGAGCVVASTPSPWKMGQEGCSAVRQ